MLVLGIDTSAVAASCAVCELDENSQKVIVNGSVNAKITHSQTLIPLIENLLSGANISLQQIDLFAVSGGPGSFTGLRIALSAVKGMAFALDKPCVNVSTLEALAYNLVGKNCIACAVMDARCNQLYNALFRVEGTTISRITEDRALFIPELAAELDAYNEEIVFVGDGAELAYKNIKKDNIVIAPPLLRYQKGESVCFASENKEQISPKELIPVYLRLPQAERERMAKLEKV